LCPPEGLKAGGERGDAALPGYEVRRNPQRRIAERIAGPARVLDVGDDALDDRVRDVLEHGQESERAAVARKQRGATFAVQHLAEADLDRMKRQAPMLRVLAEIQGRHQRHLEAALSEARSERDVGLDVAPRADGHEGDLHARAGWPASPMCASSRRANSRTW